ncbi:MAG: TonB-dependent receptor family protein, partial [Nitrospiria bacterium]
TDTSVYDTTLRLTFPTVKGGEMNLRFNFYREISQTPGGLSPAQFAADPNQSQRSHDWFLGRRGSFDMRLNVPVSGELSSETLFYLNFFERNWFIANGADSPAVTTNRQFLRDFFVVGFEPRVRFGKSVVGVKVHYEQQNDVRRQGTAGVDTRSGSTDREADLSTTAVAAYLETELNPTSGFTVIPGIRYEHLDQKRNVGLRGTVSGVGGRAETSELTWGLGLRSDFSGGAVYANVHRTFQPPTFNEAVDPSAATDQDLDAETGTNYEIGVRSEIGSRAYVDLAAFFIAFDNQIVDVGGTDQNAGETEHQGLEGSFVAEPLDDLLFDLNLTYLQTEAKTGANIGKDLPMAPEIKLAWGASYERALGGGQTANIRLEGILTDEQFTDSANTIAEDVTGGAGQLESYVVWNLKAQYDAASWKAFAGINNLLDEEYRERRQSFFGGIIPGVTQNFYGGVSLLF